MSLRDDEKWIVGVCYKHFEPNGSLSSCLIEPLGSKCL